MKFCRIVFFIFFPEQMKKKSFVEVSELFFPPKLQHFKTKHDRTRETKTKTNGKVFFFFSLVFTTTRNTTTTWGTRPTTLAAAGSFQTTEHHTTNNWVFFLLAQAPRLESDLPLSPSPLSLPVRKKVKKIIALSHTHTHFFLSHTSYICSYTVLYMKGNRPMAKKVLREISVCNREKADFCFSSITRNLKKKEIVE